MTGRLMARGLVVLGVARTPDQTRIAGLQHFQRSANAATKPRLWAAAKSDLGFFDLAPDGKHFAVMQTEPTKQNGAAQLTFLLNFFDELRRRAPVGRK